jgi:hypothetical protein
MPDRPQMITFADMRDMGVHGLLIYCSEVQPPGSLSGTGQSRISRTMRCRTISA